MLRLSKEAINTQLKCVVVDWSEYSCELLNRVVKLVKAGGRLARNEWKHIEEYPYHILDLKTKDLDQILKRYRICRVSKNIYVKSNKLCYRLRHVTWLTHKKGLQLYSRATSIAKRLFLQTQIM